MNKGLAWLVAAGLTAVPGCSTMKDTSQSMGSTGTGIITGILVGVGTGVLCKVVLGGSTGACVGAGLALGAASGLLAAHLDEEWSKSVPVADCKGVKAKLNYLAGVSPPIMAGTSMELDRSPPVYKPGEPIKTTLHVSLATPNDKDIVGLRIRNKDTKQETKAAQRQCGGYDSVLSATAPNSDGAYWIQYDLINDQDNKVLSSARVCASISPSGQNKCSV